MKCLKSISIFVSLIFSFQLFSCDGNQTDKVNHETTCDILFNNKKAVFSLSNELTNTYNVYEINDSQSKLLCQTNNSIFESEDLFQNYQFVPVINNAEDREHQTSEMNYINGVFSSNNVKVFSINDSVTEIQKYIDYQYSSLRGDEFSDKRSAILFLPGDYSNVTLHLGYYTTINGLGMLPTDVVFNKLEVNNHPTTGNALINFWRTAENFTINNDSLWAVSQATSLRRTYFKKTISLSDNTPGGDNFSSGGFIADSIINSSIQPGSQQQWFMRNSIFSSWPYASMNMVFLGAEGSVPQGDYYSNKTTFIDKTSIIREKPFIVFDEEKGYGINVPSLKENSSGVSWKQNNIESSTFVSLNDFYIGHPEKDTATSLNQALDNNKHLLLTPGIYNLDEPLHVKNNNTIIYGLGMATLNITEKNQDALIKVDDLTDITLCGLLFQAGKYSKTLLEIGVDSKQTDSRIYLSDLFFRVGGNTVENTSCDCCAILNANNIIGDNFWVWRADHGMRKNNDSRYGIGWNKNQGKNGIIINGNNVSMYGLMVEHFQEYQTIWNGEDGLMVFYQSETPYDALKQSDWMRIKDSNEEFDQGFASYKINDDVLNHEAYGIGIYFVNSIDITKYCHHAIEVPSNGGIFLEHMVARYFAGKGYIRNVINDIHGAEDNYHNLALKRFSGGEYL